MIKVSRRIPGRDGVRRSRRGRATALVARGVPKGLTAQRKRLAASPRQCQTITDPPPSCPDARRDADASRRTRLGRQFDTQLAFFAGGRDPRAHASHAERKVAATEPCETSPTLGDTGRDHVLSTDPALAGTTASL